LVVVTGALEQQTATEYAFGFHNTPDGDRTATPGPSITGRCFAFSPDGRFIAAAQEHTVEGRLERNLSLYDLTLGKPFALLPHTAPMGIRTHAMAFSPDSRLLAAAGQQLFNMPGRGVVGAITIHDISSGQQIATLIPQDKKSGLEYAVSAIAFSPTGAFLAAGTFYGDVHVWSVSTLAPVKTHKVRGTVRSLAFSPDGGLLACGAGDTVSLLRAPSFAEVTIVAPSIRRFRDGPPSEVLSLGFVPNGTRLWSLWGHIRDGLESGRSRVVLWTVPEGRHLVTFSHERARWLDIDGNGEFVVTADQDSVLRVWRLNGQLNRAVLLQRSL